MLVVGITYIDFLSSQTTLKCLFSRRASKGFNVRKSYLSKTVRYLLSQEFRESFRKPLFLTLTAVRREDTRFDYASRSPPFLERRLRLV